MRIAAMRRTPPFDRLLFLASRWTPKLHRVLLLESGSRSAAARFIEHLYGSAETQSLDVLTCYNEPPQTFDSSRGRVLYTHHSQGRSARRRLYRELSPANYCAVCVLGTGDNIMPRWKWMVAV